MLRSQRMLPVQRRIAGRSKGEFLSALQADEVYRLLGTDGMGGSAPPEKMPQADQAIRSGTIGYHLRTGNTM